MIRRRPFAVRCFYCGEGFTSDDPRTIEHLLAKSRGGDDRISNLKAAHKSCNEAVGNLPVDIKRKLAGNMPRGKVPHWALDAAMPVWLHRLLHAADRDPSWASKMAARASDGEINHYAETGWDPLRSRRLSDRSPAPPPAPAAADER